MKILVDIEYIKKTGPCNFGKKCLEEFDSSLCCKIIKENSHYLMISPISTFKSSNCSFARQIKSDDKQMQICTCPVRFEIYKKYKI